MAEDFSAAVHQHPDGVAVDLWVVPGASRSGVMGMHGDRVKVRVGVPAQAGKANEAVAAIVAAKLGVASVALETGRSSRAKRVVAAGISVAEAVSRLSG